MFIFETSLQWSFLKTGSLCLIFLECLRSETIIFKFMAQRVLRSQECISTRQAPTELERDRKKIGRCQCSPADSKSAAVIRFAQLVNNIPRVITYVTMAAWRCADAHAPDCQIGSTSCLKFDDPYIGIEVFPDNSWIQGRNMLRKCNSVILLQCLPLDSVPLLSSTDHRQPFQHGRRFTLTTHEAGKARKFITSEKASL